MKTIQDFQKTMQQQGTLSDLLKPEDFAPEQRLADNIAREFKKDLKPTQTRRIFNTIKQVERHNRRAENSAILPNEDRSRLTLLSPELAYAAGRGLIPSDFYAVLKTCLQQDKLKTVGDLRRLVEFLSAVVAYQKYHVLNN